MWNRADGLFVRMFGIALEKTNGEWGTLVASLLAGNGLVTGTATRPYRIVLPPSLVSVLRTRAHRQQGSPQELCAAGTPAERLSDGLRELKGHSAL